MTWPLDHEGIKHIVLLGTLFQCATHIYQVCYPYLRPSHLGFRESPSKPAAKRLVTSRQVVTNQAFG